MDAFKKVVAEIQGTYGPLRVSEILLQKIWMKQDFRLEGLQTVDGKPIAVLNAGTWNHQDGPDFLNALLKIGNRRILGDIEVHFYTRDWFAHRHDSNPGFDNVILHIVLFPTLKSDAPARTFSGRIPEHLVMLPFLDRDIEDYITDEALLQLENRDTLDLVEPMLLLNLIDRRRLLLKKSMVRWQQKQRTIHERCEKHGWSETCHQLCLEVLGYRRNRSAMSDLAARFPLSLLLGRNDLNASDLFEAGSGRWVLKGLRPPNHPRRRLEQYHGILSVKGNWPERMCHAPILGLARGQGFLRETRFFRKTTRMADLRLWFKNYVLDGKIPGPRLDTLICDAFLPLLSEYQDQGEDLFEHWYHWYSGDMPVGLRRYLRTSGACDGLDWPVCNGANQGVLQLFIEDEDGKV